MPRIDANIKSLVQPMLARGRVESADVDKLLDESLKDKVLSPTERNDLKALLQQNPDKFSADAKAKLQTFLGMKSVTLRNASHELNKDGVIDASDARKLVDLATKDGKISSGEKFSLSALMVGGRMNAEAKAIVAARLNGEGGPTGAPTINLNLPAVNGSNYTLSPDGHLQVGANSTPPRFDANGALAAYRGAQALAQAPVDVLKTVPVDVKTRMVAHLEKCFDAGADVGSLPSVEKARFRSAAATTLLAVIQGSAGPFEKTLRDAAIATYVKHAMAESNPNLRASMYFNLTELRGTLSTEQKTALDGLRNQVVPQKPPYEKWFAQNGERAINVKHYAHDDCWTNGADPISNYTAQGFTIKQKDETARPPRWLLEKVDNNAAGGPVTMRVEVKRTHDGIFEDMDDPKTNVVLYIGHSNLGGNVSEELRLGDEQRGDKFVIMAMCRGKQNMPEFANRYPNANFITTDNPSYFSTMPSIQRGITNGLLSGKDYEGMQKGVGNIWDEGGISNYFFPHEERRYALYDLDQDGRMDSQGAGRDRLFDVALSLPAGTKVDLQPRDNTYKPDELDGGKVLHAVQFLNTLTTYHVDHGGTTSKFARADMDAFLGGGWFEGPKDEPVRIKKETIDGKTFYRVSVNKAYADQSQFALGTLVQFETCRMMLKERNGGVETKQDVARAIIFAGEYLSYMYCSYEEAEGSMRALSAMAGLGRFGFETVGKAIEVDGHGYVTDTQVNALLEKLGQLTPAPGPQV